MMNMIIVEMQPSGDPLQASIHCWQPSVLLSCVVSAPCASRDLSIQHDILMESVRDSNCQENTTTALSRTHTSTQAADVTELLLLN